MTKNIKEIQALYNLEEIYYDCTSYIIPNLDDDVFDHMVNLFIFNFCDHYLAFRKLANPNPKHYDIIECQFCHEKFCYDLHITPLDSVSLFFIEKIDKICPNSKTNILFQREEVYKNHLNYRFSLSALQMMQLGILNFEKIKGFAISKIKYYRKDKEIITELADDNLEDRYYECSVQYSRSNYNYNSALGHDSIIANALFYAFMRFLFLESKISTS